MQTDKPVAVKYTGSWKDHSGYGEANRQFIYALHIVGIDITTDAVSFVKERSDYGIAHALAEKLEHRSLEYDIKIIHLTPDQYMTHLEPLKYHIGHLFWETDRIPPYWVWTCNRLDEIWTGTEGTKSVLIKSGVRVPIWVFPEPILEPTGTFEPYIIPNHSGYMFYSIFEWTKRKNPEALLLAYWKEFEGNDKVSLLLKTFRDDFSYQNHQKIKEKIQKLKELSGVKVFPRVLYSGELLTQEEMFRLHATGDCLVSTHRGEGWGRPQAEAMIMGKPIISTNAGGIHEYLNDTVAYLTQSVQVPVEEEDDRPFYTKDQNWAEVLPEDLRAKMRFVFDDQVKGKKVGIAAKKFIKENFSPEKIGAAMKKRLEAIQKSV